MPTGIADSHALLAASARMRAGRPLDSRASHSSHDLTFGSARFLPMTV
jgi:hypothetical protein